MKKVLFLLISLISIAALVIGTIALVQINLSTKSENSLSSTQKPESESTTQKSEPDFPDFFQIGAASSAYQIEGGWNEDGKSPNIWDDGVHNFPETIKDKSTGDEAADSYHRYKDDIAALKESGFNHYRFSISWSRILPSPNQPNEIGINYYNNLINELIANNIKPLITMYHWDLPSYVQSSGGWLSPTVIAYFEQYASLIYERYSDRVKTFITFNEPLVFCEHGHGQGFEPPFIKLPGVGPYICGRHMLLAHAKAYHIYKDKYAAKNKGMIGICLNSDYFFPYEGEDPKLTDQGINHLFGWFANPIYSKEGNYPAVMIENVKRNSGDRPSRLPELTKEEIDYVKGTSDFLALNYYTSRIVKPKENFPEVYDIYADMGLDMLVDQNWSRALSDWLYSVPDGLYKLLLWIKDNYNNPIVMISENGYSDDGEIEDDNRIKYIREHLYAVKRAINQGCNVTAYTIWSLIDNFEWSRGYTERFGIYYVDFNTKRRLPKKSSKYFKELTKTRKI